MLSNRFLPSIFLVIAVFTFIIPETSADTWNCGTIIESKYFTDISSRAIAVDSNNHPHFAYGGDHLYYAYYDGSAWHYETADSSSGVGRYASIALDSSGKVHISYYDETNKDLKYATNASGSWVTTTVYNSRNFYSSIQEGRYYISGEGYTSIAIDASGKVHINYSVYYNGSIKYATNSSGSWLTTIIDERNLDESAETSITLDESDNAHISYYNSPSLKYATMHQAHE